MTVFVIGGTHQDRAHALLERTVMVSSSRDLDGHIITPEDHVIVAGPTGGPVQDAYMRAKVKGDTQ